jgi:hypothetical protein
LPDLFGHTRDIKALSLWQPWASLMALGYKMRETRHWSTNYRGVVAIHAAKTVDGAGAPDELCIAALGREWPHTVPRGEILAIGDLTRCVEASRVRDQTAADREAGNFTPGRFAWVFENIRRFRRPIPTLGRQGLFRWTLPDDVEALLYPPIDHAEACRLIGWA